MSVLCCQPFKNKYTISQLESFGIDTSNFSERDINKYLFKGKGKIAKIARDIDECLSKDTDINQLNHDIVQALFKPLDELKRDGKIKYSTISIQGFEQDTTGIALNVKIGIDTNMIKSKIKNIKKR